MSVTAISVHSTLSTQKAILSTVKTAKPIVCWEHTDKIGNGKLRLHLRSFHPRRASGTASAETTVSVGPQRPCNDNRQEKITSLLVKCLVANMLPLPLVDNVEFRELLSFMEPNYTVPYCNMVLMSTRLDSMKADLSIFVSSEMQCMTAVHITTDIRSTITNERYISITSLFISDACIIVFLFHQITSARATCKWKISHQARKNPA